MTITELMQKGLLQEIGDGKYLLNAAGEEAIAAVKFLHNLGWEPLETNDQGYSIKSVLYQTHGRYGIHDAYNRLRNGETITYQVLHSGKVLQARPVYSKSLGWYVQFEVYEGKKYIHRFYLNREDVAAVLHNGVDEMKKEETHESLSKTP